MKLYNNDQCPVIPNCDISGIAKYATGDYGAAWVTTAAITAALTELFPEPVNGDIAILRNTNGTDDTRVYIYAGGAWESLDSASIADGAVTAAKLAANAVETAKIKDANVTAAKLATDAVETAKIKNANVTPAKLSAAAGSRIFSYQVEDLGAGVDITGRAIFAAPAGMDVTITKAYIIPQGTAAGIDDSNTCLINLSDGTNTLVGVTYKTDPAFPAASSVTELGTVHAVHGILSAGEKLYLTVTNGSTANPPAFMLQLVYTVADA